MQHIQPLPQETRTRLRSTQILTSLPQLVSELVQNSLDSRASHIDIGLDFAEWSCWVRDDGVGIPVQGLDHIGSGDDNGRYGSSKAHTTHGLDHLTTFGFRGEALASAADLACLEISSRSTPQSESWSVIAKGGKRLYFGPAVRWRRERPGTVVCIRDAFYNLPIRRISHPSASRTLELIIKDTQSFSLVFPEVAFSVENTTRDRDGELRKTRGLSIPKTSSILHKFRAVFGRALAEHVDEIDVREGDMGLRGFISRDGSFSRAYQFLYVNRHLLAPCELHHIIDSQFVSSTYGRHGKRAYAGTGSEKIGGRKSPRKSERRSVYVLSLQVPSRTLDVCFVPSKDTVQFQDLNSVSSFLISTVQSFLERHGFLVSTSSIRASHEGSGNNSRSGLSFPPSPLPCPKKRRKLLEHSHGNPSPPHHPSSHPKISIANSESPPTPSLCSFGDHNAPPIYGRQFPQPQEFGLKEEEDAEYGADTGGVFTAERRARGSYPQGIDSFHGLDENVSEDPAILPSKFSHVDKTRVRRPRLKSCSGDSARCVDEGPSWIKNMVEEWENPVYYERERDVPTISIATTHDLTPAFLAPGLSSQGRASTSRFFDSDALNPEAISITRRFTREDLSNATVMGQVDAKFIACAFSTPKASSMSLSSKTRTKANTAGENTSTVVLIDQHAADERIRVERFLEELCIGFLDGNMERRDISAHPARVLLTMAEARSIATSREVQAAFDRWGLRFSKDSVQNIVQQLENNDETWYTQLEIETVPEVIADKLISEEELQDVIKGFLARLDSEGTSYGPPVEDPNMVHVKEAHMWMKALRWCPKELLDLINSKACRGAIMFNDPLTPEQCSRLVSQLSRTLFPFQCAHGRPSLVPITSVQEKRGLQPARMITWSDYGSRDLARKES